MLVQWWLSLAGFCAAGAPSLGDYFDSFPGFDSDFSRDDLYGYGSFGDFRRGRSYDDYFGGGAGSYGGGFNVGPADRKDMKDAGKDDCSRIEADGVPLADLLMEAAENLPAKVSEASAQVLELIHFFSSKEHQAFLLGHCPQAVALAVLLEAEIQVTESSEGAYADGVQRRAVLQLSDLLDKAQATWRSPFKALPTWSGKWGEVLGAAQRRTGILLFPIGEQQFHVDFVPAANWSIWANRRCRGRRDLGNLQGTLLATCLEKCLSHPSCRSATFWHWQPGGMGFDQRCFLSSSCTFELSTDEGAENAFLFEKLAVLSQQEQHVVQQTIRTKRAAWAPRAGHQVLATASGATRLWLLGGIGVDPFANSSAPGNDQEAKPEKEGKKRTGKGKGSAEAKRAGKRRNATAGLDVVEAYLSRHVELSGELPPLRSLPYSRLGDVWWSADEGSSWTLMQQMAPWGPRAYFGAVAVQDGRYLLVFGGIVTPKDTGNSSLDGLGRQYVNDVWYADLSDASPSFHELSPGPWEPRAAFQALVWKPGRLSGKADVEEVVLMGGRTQEGTLKNDVWALPLENMERLFSGSASTWERRTSSADWSPRSEFAAATTIPHGVWILGGCGEAGAVLADVWQSRDLQMWSQVQPKAPWGPCVGGSAVTLSLGDITGVLLFGGYAYPDADFGPLPPSSQEEASAWFSSDGELWLSFGPEFLAWTSGTTHAAAAAAPCNMSGSSEGQLCAYVAGGTNREGYYDNTVRQLRLGDREARLLDSPRKVGGPERSASTSTPDGPEDPSRSMQQVVATCLLGLALPLCYLLKPKAVIPVDPAGRCYLKLLLGLFILLVGMGVLVGFVLSRFSQELAQLRAEKCHLDAHLLSELRDTLGLTQAAKRWDEFEVLLRLASRESQYYAYGFGGGKSGDPYGYGYGRYDRGYDGFGGADEMSGRESGPKEDSPQSLKKELSMLPTIQSVSCRTPKCDRNATCASTSQRSLQTPYGCCSDYMLLMLADVTGWLHEQGIPYFITYGTLLGAVREKDILPWTQDMDIVVDRRYWPQLQRGLEAAEFFGGRRYLFGVDQWEEKVSRVCADWEGFASSIIGGQEGDRFSRPADFHLDVYASDWWQITDLHLVDCVEPLGTNLQIRGRNFSAPARPRACVEKLYGAEWRTPKKALAGVN
ncbi:ADO2 [Symbiodinium natans]|uniref:ADO2 protein n=1 Tax=Symbiodinium natans TaxID=878477 RepID=A0A812P756_9DINO|nr:ADO2 [Symbiodinium natans]